MDICNSRSFEPSRERRTTLIHPQSCISSLSSAGWSSWGNWSGWGGLSPFDLWKSSHADPQVDERLHWLDVLVGKQIEESAYIDEVNEAGVELTVQASVPEEQPVLPIEVSVTAEHLLVHVLHLGFETLRKTGCLAKPVVWVTCNLRSAWEWRG